MEFQLINYPQQSAFGKVLPKSKIYEHAKPSNAVKDLFVKQVEQIVWSYKLSPETINIQGGDGVQEIQIFTIQSKVPEISEQVFRTIDNAIPSYVFYEVVSANMTRLVAAFKRPSDMDSSKFITGTYFYSEWVRSSSERENIPVALNMDALYALLMQKLMPLGRRENENLRSFSERIELLRIKNGELNKLKIKLSRERQFNRKVELNSQMKDIEMQIKKLNF